eukprot:scaffold273522_cov30-Prasinocladus_malaysianus.AAC.1
MSPRGTYGGIEAISSLPRGSLDKAEARPERRVGVVSATGRVYGQAVLKRQTGGQEGTCGVR